MAVRTKNLALARPNRESNQQNRDLSDYHLYPSARGDTTQARAGPYPSSDEYPLPPSWDMSTSTELDEYTDTSHLPMSPSYKSPFGLQNAPASTKHGVESVDCEDSGQCHNMQWEHTGKPVFWSGLEHRSTAGFLPWILDSPSGYGDQSNIAPEFPMQYVETPYYINQTQQNSSFANTGNFLHQPKTNIDPEDSLFPTDDFFTTQPQNPTEIAFVATLLEYTRAQFRSLMSEEPPQSSPLLSYAERYHDMQTYLEQMWPFPNSPPPKLRSIGPVRGSSN